MSFPKYTKKFFLVSEDEYKRNQFKSQQDSKIINDGYSSSLRFNPLENPRVSKVKKTRDRMRQINNDNTISDYNKVNLYAAELQNFLDEMNSIRSYPIQQSPTIRNPISMMSQTPSAPQNSKETLKKDTPELPEDNSSQDSTVLKESPKKEDTLSPPKLNEEEPSSKSSRSYSISSIVEDFGSKQDQTKAKKLLEKLEKSGNYDSLTGKITGSTGEIKPENLRNLLERKIRVKDSSIVSSPFSPSSFEKQYNLFEKIIKESNSNLSNKSKSNSNRSSSRKPYVGTRGKWTTY